METSHFRAALADEERTGDALDWATTDADETDAPRRPEIGRFLATRPPERGARRIFVERATISVPGQAPFVLDRAGREDPDGCLMHRAA